VSSTRVVKVGAAEYVGTIRELKSIALLKVPVTFTIADVGLRGVVDTYARGLAKGRRDAVYVAGRIKNAARVLVGLVDNIEAVVAISLVVKLRGGNAYFLNTVSLTRAVIIVVELAEVYTILA